MLGNCEEKMMMLISSSSTTNQWPPQIQVDDQKVGLMMASDKQQQQPNIAQNQNQNQNQNQLQVALKCPRCDSSNTKFCYYNNYSLSQPRHFCKACKRYWTRGGTLRNVPVGGGCRRNKRAKRPTSDPPSSSSLPNPNTIQHHHIENNISPTSNHGNNTHLFYGLPTSGNPSDLNLQYPNGFNSQLSGLGLGFSSDYSNGFNPTSYSLFGSAPTSNSPSMASLLASTFHHQKFMSNGLKDIRGSTNNGFHGLQPYEEDLQMRGGIGEDAMKEVKMEENHNRFSWNVPSSQNLIEQIGASSDPSLYWNTAGVGVGAWLDPTNLGPSVPSLI